jgi:hypothetical protein
VTCVRTQVKANEMGRSSGTPGRGEEIVQGFGGKARRKETARKTKSRMVSEWILARLASGVGIGFD